MKIGILVTYVFEDRHVALVRLHLARIRANTDADYRIYGAVNRVPEHLLGELEGQPDLTPIVCASVPSHLRGREEHAGCIEELARHAMDDGCEVLVTLHLDSFPISKAWAERVIAPLQQGSALTAMVPHCYTACLAWQSGFADDVALILSEEAKATDAYRDFANRFAHYNTMDSGLGLVFHCWQSGQNWTELGPNSEHIFGKSIFHLVAGIRFSDARYAAIDKTRPAYRVRQALAPVWNRLPVAMRERLRRPFADPGFRTHFGSPEEKQRQLEELLGNPDAFIEAELRKAGMA